MVQIAPITPSMTNRDTCTLFFLIISDLFENSRKVPVEFGPLLFVTEAKAESSGVERHGGPGFGGSSASSAKSLHFASTAHKGDILLFRFDRTLG